MPKQLKQTTESPEKQENKIPQLVEELQAQTEELRPHDDKSHDLTGETGENDTDELHEEVIELTHVKRDLSAMLFACTPQKS